MAADAELTSDLSKLKDPSRRPSWSERAATWQWWLFVAIGLGLYITFQITTDNQTQKIFWFIIGQTPEGLRNGQILVQGVVMTLTVALSGYALALTIGLFMGLMRSSSQPILYNLSSFYVEIFRGIPILVLLLYVAFALTPLFVSTLNLMGVPLSTRDIPLSTRAIIALALGYGSFSAEIFRAGIESIENGQHEASSALGMSYIQKMRFVVLPQAVRRVLPPLGNDFIAIVKDSSLVSVLGVRDLTQLTRLYYNSTFLYLQSLTMLAFVYLVIIVLLTRGVRLMERRLARAYER